MAPDANVEALAGVRKQLQRQIGWFFSSAMLTVIFGVFCSFVICFIFFIYADTRSLMLLRMIQVTLGLCIGFTVIVLGVVVAWLGITASIRLKGGTSEASIVLACSSPGVLLLLCGTGLACFALAKTLTVEWGDAYAGQAPKQQSGRQQQTLLPRRFVMEQPKGSSVAEVATRVGAFNLGDKEMEARKQASLLAIDAVVAVARAQENDDPERRSILARFAAYALDARDWTVFKSSIASLQTELDELQMNSKRPP